MCSSDLSHGGGGGGGRIALYYGAGTFTGSLAARGGSGAQWGGAGTVFRQVSGAAAGALTIENGGAWGAYTPLALPVTASFSLSNMAQVFPTAPLALAALQVGANGVLFHYPTQSLSLTISGSAQIDVGGSITANGCGYPIGTNAGPGAAPFTTDDGGGGGYGGDGGYAYWGPSEPGGSGGYGSMLTPTDLGSAGAGSSDDGLNRTAGGGAIRMVVGGVLTVNGQLTANGQAAYQNDQGGGSGGSLWLTVGELAGAGTISANGGNGEDSHGGGGGGGRSAIYFATNNFIGTLSANGSSGTQWGGAGTIYLKSASLPVGTLSVRNAGVDGALTPLPPPAELCHFVLSSSARAWVPFAYTVASLAVNAGGHLFPAPGVGTLEVRSLGDISIGSSGEISVSGRGYPFGADHGPGAGASGGTHGGGGAYGGNGGGGYYGEAGGIGGYGSVLEPTTYGSAGGSGNSGAGGAGGGAIKLTVGGTLTVDGSLSADGAGAPSNNAGGGAGGSIWATAYALAGTGTISANGGIGEAGDGGGGGGGRIAGYFTQYSFTGTASAGGAGGRQYGGAGTIYRELSTDTQGELLCDNQGHGGAMTPLVAPLTPGLTISGGAIVYPQRNQPFTLVSLDVGGGGQLTHLNGQQLEVIVLADAEVQTNGLIAADGVGYPVGTNAGPGAGTFGGDTGSGGGYGGRGGHGWEGQPGGGTYGSAAAPVDGGSAGGPGESGWRTSGGGVVHLDVRGTLTVHGAITANGQGAFDNDQGGAAGGSVWLNVGSLVGTGSIAANGGAGEGSDGGGGGGGRVAIYHNGLSLNPARITANGASGNEWGGNGTVFFGSVLSNLPPAVLAVVPAGTVAGWVEAIDVTFNVAVNGATFTPLDVVFTTPSGVLPVTQITVTELTPQVFRIGFPTQTTDGLYTVQVGPAIANPFGTTMVAPHTSTFTISFPHTLTYSNGPGGFNISWPTTAGLFYQLQTSLNLITWVDATGWLAGTGAPLPMTFPTTNAPQQFFRVVMGD